MGLGFVVVASLFSAPESVKAGSSACQPSDHAVTTTLNQFVNGDATISPSGVVCWRNTSPGTPHTITPDVPGSFTGTNNLTSDAFRVTFPTGGTYRYHCAFHGSAGGIGMSGTVTVPDNTAPPAPSSLATSPVSPANDNSPEISGVAEPGSNVQLFTGATCNAEIGPPTPAAQFAMPGITASVGDNSTTAFSAKATDAAGNVSDCSLPVSYTEDSTLPSTPEITGSNPTSPSSIDSPSILGTADAGDDVALYMTNNCTGPVAGSAEALDGTFSIAVTVPENEETTFFAQADNGTNLSGCSGGFTYEEDSTAPVLVVLTSKPKKPTTKRKATFRWTEEPDTIYTCSIDGLPGEACDGDGTFYEQLKRGKHVFTVFGTDDAGNVGPTQTYTWKIIRR
jgi:plastocyanin